MSVIPLLRRPSRPSPEAMQRATVKTYQLGAITRQTAIDQLERQGMSPVAANRAIADAIEVKG